MDGNIKDKISNLSKDTNIGFHDEGIGWNPQGVYCGECGRSTCIACINLHLEKTN